MYALVDGDILVYRCGFAAEKSYHYVLNAEGELLGTFESKRDANEYVEEVGEGATIHSQVVPEPVENALQMVRTSLNHMFDSIGGVDNDRIYLTGKGNFRDSIATIQPYKGNREEDRKPTHYDAIRAYLIEEHGASVVDGMEADDALGIHSMSLQEAKDSDPDAPVPIIVSIDKDLDMIPGWHYNWVKKAKYHVTPWMALKHFYTQLLTGDPTDNIRGVPGLGPAKAAKQLVGCHDEYDLYCKCVEAYKGNLAELNENAQLLWIRRYPDDKWSPPE